MKNIIQINKQFFGQTITASSSKQILKNIVSQLNKKGIILISGLLGSNKIGIVKEIVTKAKMQNNFFYFNGELDIDNKIKNCTDLSKLYNQEKIIILENIDEIDQAELFIKSTLKSPNKVILIGNGIKIKGVLEVEILPKFTHLSKFHKSLSYNKYLENNFQSNYLELLTHKIITKDIFIKHKIKNFTLLQSIIQLLSQTNTLTSVRELHGTLKKKSIKISQITLLEYIDYILDAKLVKKILRYDLKIKKSSIGKAKYFFTDTQTRNICGVCNLEKHILLENLIYQKLEKLGGTLFTGKNGKFDFSFITKDTPIPLKGTSPLQEEEDKELIVHVSEYLEKNEVKKEAKKLLKIPGDYKKYLLVNSIKEIGIRPSTYKPLTIMEIGDFLKD